MKIAIVAVGYNRPDSMQRLIESLLNANYYNYKVDLIFSIDKGEKQDQIIEVAEECIWKHGEKHIRAFSEKQGLRKHILQCGSLTEIYDAIVVLEDDLIVSNFFFKYVVEALRFYKNEDEIAGISLYTHQTHPGVRRPFEAVNNGYDTFLMQFAMSWGQCWTKKMWKEFRNWYSKNENSDLGRDGYIPSYIAKWNQQSWLKYYMRYIVETKKYFVYPYVALSTNASDIGEHCSTPNNDYQIALLQGDKEYKFASISDAIKYDIFFERIGIEEKVFPELKGSKILDLYGSRNEYGKYDYIVSTRRLPYEIVGEYSLKYRPIEMNCMFPSIGNGIYVYNSKKRTRRIVLRNEDILTRYEVRAIHWKRLLRLGFRGLNDAICRRLKRVK